MGSIIMNGVRIGEQCLIGANTLIPEGKVIPPRTMVFGAPGKIVRELTEAEIVRITETAGNYQRNWRKYAAGVKRQADA
jgi:carbonic anhydrase/acetyltransferase-like protein (isoleucine patch superfamily)